VIKEKKAIDQVMEIQDAQPRFDFFLPQNIKDEDVIVTKPFNNQIFVSHAEKLTQDIEV
jgi:hypothetical protein